MGRKSAKSRDKKIKRKEERKEDDARIAAAQAIVDAANKLEDPMETLLPFKKYDRNGLQMKIECKKVKDLDKETVDWAFNLTKENMKQLYVDSDWGWSEKVKKEEMSEDAAWYLIARNQDNVTQAMVHFRFDLDNEDEVLYCYEIQLTKPVRRKGLGRFMMQILEMVALFTHMKKVVLTVFKHNQDSSDFFRKNLKYELDETNPEVEHVFEEDYCYIILSKPIGLKKLKQKQNETNGHEVSLKA